MAISLLQRWLEHYDPIHRGWTPAGIANGVCTTCGFAFPRIRGGYNLFRDAGGVPAPRGQVVGAAGCAASQIRTFPWVRQGPGACTYRLVAIGGGGVENWSEQACTSVVLDASGAWLGALPNAPVDLRATAAAGGRFELRWAYFPDGQHAEPAEFRVYHDAGSGTIDYGNPAAAVPFRAGRIQYAHTSGAFAEGLRVRWAVRAASSAGAEESNQVIATAAADGMPPESPPAFLAVADE